MIVRLICAFANSAVDPLILVSFVVKVLIFLCGLRVLCGERFWLWFGYSVVKSMRGNENHEKIGLWTSGSY